MQNAAVQIDETNINIKFNNELRTNEKTITAKIESQEVLKSEDSQKTAIVGEHTPCSSLTGSVVVAPVVHTNQGEWQWQESSAEDKDLSANEESKKDESVNKSTNINNENQESLKSSSYLLNSGHAKTHSIIINLDEKSRFTEEVTV